jgi:hypothetical protein
VDNGKSGLTLWPERILGPRPGLKELNVICWSVFICFIVVPICAVLFIQYKTGKLFFLHSPVDFIYVYGTGQIANAHPPVDVYDYTLQKQTFNKIQPLHEGMYGPSPYPPLVSQFFRLFARLPFAEAYFLWMGVSIVLYVTGIALTLNSFLPDQKLENSLLFCFALAFSAFLMNTLADGQLSAVAVCFVGVALALERRSKFFISGLALSVLTYKFTFLFLLVPMLLLTRRFRSFAGFATGTGILVAVTTAFTGPGVWPAYVRLVNGYGHTSGLYGKTSLRLWKYVDFNTFSYAILGRRTPIEFALLVCVVVSALAWLGILLWQSKRDSRPEANLAWAATLTWTMLLNVYYPIYDSILVVIALILALAALKELKWPGATRKVVLLASLVFLVSWFTEPVAKRFGVQLLTLALLALAIAESVYLDRAIRLRTAPKKEEALAAGF